MQAFRTIVDSQTLLPLMKIPKSMENMQVEVLVLPFNHRINPERRISAAKAKGFLQKYANPALVGMEKDAWAMHVVEKYDNI